MIRYGNAYRNDKQSAQNSLFGSLDQAADIPEPLVPPCEPWPLIELLNREKEVTGIYISGHPLDDYRLELEHFITCTLDKTAQYQHKPLLQLAGMVTHATHKISKNGNGWGVFSITDYQGALEFRLFGDDYQKFKHLLAEGMVLFIKGRFQRSWRSEEELELKITEIRLLEGIGQDLTEGITLKVPVDFL